MSKLILTLFVVTIWHLNVFSQDVVSLTVSAQGKTKEEAKYNAFRDALERAFGTFISSNTQILNDEIIKDEIVSISSGNIEKFEIKSEVQLPDETFTNVIDVTVSLNKLKSFCESKGINAEFQGGLFAANIRIERMNKENEASITRNMFETVEKIIENGIFDYSIDVKPPKMNNNKADTYDVDISVTATINKNLENVASIIKNTVRGISLKRDETIKLAEQNIPCFILKIDSDYYALRNWQSVVYLRQIFERIIPYYALNFEMGNGVTNYNFRDDIVSNRLNKNSGNINYKGLINNEFQYEKVIKFNYSLYTSMGEQGFQKYYDEVLRLGLDMDRKYFQNELQYQYGRVDWRWKTTGTNQVTLIYEEINFSNSLKNFIIFELTESLTLTELEKISEYKVKPLSK